MSSEDLLTIGTHTFRSRLFVGTGKYASVDQTRAALEASGAEVVTVALRRVNRDDAGPLASRRGRLLPPHHAR